jgi:hypothetical protein
MYGCLSIVTCVIAIMEQDCMPRKKCLEYDRVPKIGNGNSSLPVQAGSGNRSGAGVFEQGQGAGGMSGKVWLGKTNSQTF